MEPVELKLKQASGILGIPAKELQNLVQFRVVTPKKRGSGPYIFDSATLCQAQVALNLKKALGASTSRLSDFMAVFLARESQLMAQKPDIITFRSSGSPGCVVEVKVPFRKLAEDVDKGIRQLELYKDLPRGRKRARWKTEFLNSLQQAAEDMGEVSNAKIARTVGAYRSERLKPEITIVAG
jgi:hypothetical protein